MHRIKLPNWFKGVGPGFSIKKLICDVAFFISAIKLVWKSRKDQYSLVHAVEESAFIAMFIQFIWGIPYIYDMDSSMALQLTEKMPLTKPLLPIFQWFEGQAVKSSLAVVPVCDALAVLADEHGSQRTHILRDISLLDMGDNDENSTHPASANLREEVGISVDQKLILYIGNLEHYQGIDLLIESFAHNPAAKTLAKIIIIGGSKEHIDNYKHKVNTLGLAGSVFLVGPRPVSSINAYLSQADILVSPRIVGNNTPMKVYSYLHSGKALAATRLPTHTQVLDDSVSMLAEPTADSFGQALYTLITDKQIREQLGKAAKQLAEEKYTFSVFSKRLNSLYDQLNTKIEAETPQVVNS
ncbi:MAG: glycosyltransferase [Bdellovibrionota bacterium]